MDERGDVGVSIKSSTTKRIIISESDWEEGLEKEDDEVV